METLEGVIRHYGWGSFTEIPDLLGRVPDGRPWAELWLGANQSAPSLVGSRTRPLDEEIRADPIAALGRDVAERFGELPFLLKVLSASAPLSIQAHPTISQAEAGFARESHAGISIDSPQRSFRDRNHKPELICALTTFETLCGFRDPSHAILLLDAISVPRLEPLRAALTGGDEGAISRAVEWIFSVAGGEVEGIVGELIDACHGGFGDEFASDIGAILDLAKRHPSDVGVVLALLLNHVTLQPGEAMYLEAGIVHSFLRGTGVEIMANSDNVLRGGITNKHVDVAGLIDVVSMAPTGPSIQRADVRSALTRYRSPAHEFSLTRINLDGEIKLDPGPAIVLCTDGRASFGPHLLGRGSAIWLPASDGSVEVNGDATLFRAGVGEIG